MRGIPRDDNGKDVDWAKEVPSTIAQVTTLPPPVKISITDVLNRVTSKQPQQTLTLPTTTANNGKFKFKFKRELFA